MKSPTCLGGLLGSSQPGVRCSTSATRAMGRVSTLHVSSTWHIVCNLLFDSLQDAVLRNHTALVVERENVNHEPRQSALLASNLNHRMARFCRLMSNCFLLLRLLDAETCNAFSKTRVIKA